MNAPVEKSWTVPNRLELLPAVSRDVHDWLETLNLSSRARYVGRLAVEEVAGNAIKYGFPQGGDHEIAVRIAIDRDWLRLDFTDDGIPFDPTARIHAPVEDVLDNVTEGGLGLALLSRVCAKMEYRREGNHNHLVLHVRKLEPDDTQYIELSEPPPGP